MDMETSNSKDEVIQQYFDFILPLVREAGEILVNAQNIETQYKDDGDIVTKYDTQIEDILLKRIKQQYPEHKFIAEEDSARMKRINKLTDAPTWFIDPIDGTANFVKQLNMSCISVGLTIDRIQVIGIVHNPYWNELFTTIKGHGAFLNGQQIWTSKVTDISQSIFNYEISLARESAELYNLYMYRLKYLMKEVSGMRALGSAALGLCYVACGRTDAYQCDGLYPWDSAAGVLLVREAGGSVVDSSGKAFDLMNPNFLSAATTELSDKFMEIERIADAEMRNAIQSNQQFQF